VDRALHHVHAAGVGDVAGLREGDGDLDGLVKGKLLLDLGRVVDVDDDFLRAGLVGLALEDERDGLAAGDLVLGFVAACLRAADSPGPGIAAAVMATVLCGVLIVAVALDGAICVLMALPLALPLALAGAYAGWLVRRGTARTPRSFAVALVALPLAMGAEAKTDRPPALQAVTTSVVVNAPPEVVWQRVIAFPPLSEPRSLHFRAGIAYPRSATISGSGVGAVRRCRFSTGDFVEPITVWDPPRRLAFSVSAQPVPMRELSVWGEVHPPHLDGFLRSRRGEFRLTSLPGGRTLLRGTTWYENRMWPAAYWRLWSDELIGSIHERVLAHVARWAEA
jgi:hypothetical protein